MSELLLTVKRKPEKTLKGDRIAHIDKETRNTLKVSIGVPIRIRGRKNAVAIVESAFPVDVGSKIIRIGYYLRKSAGVEDGDKVRVRSISPSRAREITIAPIDERLGEDVIKRLEGSIKLVKNRALINRPFYVGNQLLVSFHRRNFSFEVIKTNPQRGAVLVTSRTTLKILRKPGAEIAEKPSKRPSKGLMLGDKYELESLLGKGNYGEVWKARDKSLDRIVAIKLLHAGIKDFSQLKSEGRALSALMHKNIVIVHDLGSDKENGWLVTELIDGESLQESLSRLILDNQWLPIERAVIIVERCLEALVYAHGKNRVHGDIKPGNILLTKKGEVKLSDFGVAKILCKSRVDVTSDLPDYKRILGSSTYSAPEVLIGNPRDFQSDLFSLGILAYVLLSGKHPFMHTSDMLSIPELIKSNTYAIPKLREMRLEINESYERIIYRLLEKDKRRRYKTAEQVLNDWRAVRMYIKCPQCRIDNPVSNNYCGRCGSRLKVA